MESNKSSLEFKPMKSNVTSTFNENDINFIICKEMGIDTTFLETDYLEESAKSDYNDALSIYNQLSDKEKKFAVPSGRYVDSSFLIARALSYSNGKPVGFADACDFKHVFGNAKHAIITTIAILPDYRNRNIAEKLISNLNKKLKGKYDNMIWKCAKENIASSKCAQKLGFTLYKQSKTEFTYIKKVD